MEVAEVEISIDDLLDIGTEEPILSFKIFCEDVEISGFSLINVYSRYRNLPSIFIQTNFNSKTNIRAGPVFGSRVII